MQVLDSTHNSELGKYFTHMARTMLIFTTNPIYAQLGYSYHIHNPNTIMISTMVIVHSKNSTQLKNLRRGIIKTFKLKKHKLHALIILKMQSSPNFHLS